MITQNKKSVALSYPSILLVFLESLIFINLPLGLAIFLDEALVIEDNNFVILDQQRVFFYVLAGALSLVLPIYTCIAAYYETTSRGLYVRVLWLLKKRFIERSHIHSISRLYPLPVSVCFITTESKTIAFQICLLPGYPCLSLSNECSLTENEGCGCSRPLAEPENSESRPQNGSDCDK